MRVFRRENAVLWSKWGIFEEKMRDFRVQEGIVTEKMHGFCLNGGVLEGKVVVFGLNGHF
jgi:hypothetical protein